MKRSLGHKCCMKCGNFFETDMRGGAKWCFPCKTIVNRDYQRDYKRKAKGRREAFYAAS